MPPPNRFVTNNRKGVNNVGASSILGYRLRHRHWDDPDDYLQKVRGMLIFKGLNDTETHALPDFTLASRYPIKGDGITYGKTYKIITRTDTVEMRLGNSSVDPAAVLAALIHHWSLLMQKNRNGEETYLTLQTLASVDYHTRHALGALTEGLVEETGEPIQTGVAG